MAMGTERSKALHNFTMPCCLRWGNQRFLRCMKVNSAGQISPPRRFADGSSDHHHHHQPTQQRRTTRERDKDSPLDFLHESPKVGPTPSYARRRFSDDAADDDGDDGIAATREKVMLDLQTAADQMKVAIFKGGLEEGEVSAPPPPAAADAEAESYCRWNLRTRRASCKTAASGFVPGKNGCSPGAAGAGVNDAGGWQSLKADAARPNSGSSHMRTAAAAIATGASQKSPMNRSDGNGTAAASGEKRVREMLSVPLSKKDIEEDYYAMVGHRPPRRPKKRSRTVQKQLDTLFPGLWLTEVTPDMYKVIETAPR